MRRSGFWEVSEAGEEGWKRGRVEVVGIADFRGFCGFSRIFRVFVCRCFLSGGWVLGTVAVFGHKLTVCATKRCLARHGDLVRTTRVAGEIGGWALAHRPFFWQSAVSGQRSGRGE